MDSIEMELKELDRQLVRQACAQFWRMLLPRERIPICDWVEHHVDLTYDSTSAESGHIQLYPYQREPLAATELDGCQEVTLCWGQRMGKSTIWKMSLLKHVADGGLSGLIVYPTMEMAQRTNQDTVMPLLMTLPEVRRDLSVRGGKKRDSYHMPSSNSIIYFLGGGAQIISLTANWTVMDETDFVRLQNSDEEGQNIDQIDAIRLRMQTFRDRMLIACSSPSIYSGVIWKNWGKGSRGEWNLRCLGCGGLFPTRQLAFRLADGSFAGLQWEKGETGDIIPSSIRWICPRCGRSHAESEAVAMNEAGRYVHANEANVRHRSFQAGALANPRLWSWLEIAEAQEVAVDPNSRQKFCNSILAMPYKYTKGSHVTSIKEAIAAKQVDYPADLGSRLSVVCAGVDQQKSELAGAKYYVFVVRGWDEHGNSWSLAHGTANSLAALESHLGEIYCGRRVALTLIDQGGFNNSQDLEPFVQSHPACFFYKGEDARTLRNRAWAPSASQGKLFLCNAVHYQVKLLGLMYDPPLPDGYRWALPVKASPDYLAQLENVVPNARMTKDGNGEAYQNWAAIGSNRRDFFDAEKMCLAAMEIACHYLPKTAFPNGNKPLFVRKEWLAEATLAQKQKRAQK